MGSLAMISPATSRRITLREKASDSWLKRRKSRRSKPPSHSATLVRRAKRIEAMGARLVLRQVGVGDASARHDALRLAAAYRDAFEGHWGDLGDGRGMAG